MKRALFGLVLLLAAASVTMAQPAGYELFFILGRETQIHSMFKTIESTQGSNVIVNGTMASIVALTATMDGQVIYYDHWEDGYETDILNPVQSSTEIIGDGNAANGQPPGDPADLLSQGEPLSLISDGSAGGINAYIPITPSRGTALRYDGGDKIMSAGGPINVVHTVYPSDGNWIGGAWEIYAVRTLESNLRYRVPVGTDTYVNGTSPYSEFQNVFLQVEAPEDNTTVVVDNGSRVINFTIQQGETWSSEGFINETAQPTLQINVLEGTSIYATTPIQAGIVTAGPGTFQSRFFQLIPEVIYGTDYINPVATTLASEPVELYLFNPSPDTNVNVRVWDSATPAAGTPITITPNNSVAYSTAVGHAVPNSSVRLQGDGLFWGIGSGGSQSTAYDWGYSLIPQQFYDQDSTVAWAPGSFALPANYSPIYVAPSVDSTDFSVDVNGDSVFDLIDTDGDGATNTPPYTQNVLGFFRLFDVTDGDQSALRVVANNPYISAYGCDPSMGNAATNLDWGYTVLPLSASFLDPVLTIEKTANPVSLPAAGGSATFTLVVQSHNHGPVSNVDIVDELPAGWTYDSGTAWVYYPNGDRYQVDPAVSGTTLTWNLSETMSVGQTLTVTLSASVAPTTISETFATQAYNGGTNWATNWMETGEADGALAGNIQVINYDAPQSSPNHVYINANRSLTRGADISTMDRPVLSFYWRLRSLEGGEFAYLDISTDNGSSWTNGIRQWGNGQDDNAYHFDQVDLSLFRSNQFMLRFRTTGFFTAWDHFYFDDVTIQSFAHENEAQASGQLALNAFETHDTDTVYTTDLSMAKSVSVTSAAVGDIVTYVLTITNTGATALSNVVITDPIPPNTSYVTGSQTPVGTFSQASNQLSWSTASLAASASTTLGFSVLVGTAANGTIVENQARGTADGLPVIRSERAEFVIAAPQLAIQKTGPANVEPNGQIDYELFYSNSGGATATGVVVIDAIPNNTGYIVGSAAPAAITSFSNDGGSTWTYSPVGAAGATDTNVTHVLFNVDTLTPSPLSSSVDFSVRVLGSAPAGAAVLNWASIDSAQTPDVNSNVLFTYISNVLMTKSGSRSIARPGHLIDFDIDFWNIGGSAVNSVIVTDPIPDESFYISNSVSTSAGVTVLYSTDNGQTFSASDGSTGPGLVTTVTHLQFSLASLPGGAASTASVGFTVRVTNPLQGDTTIENQSSLVTSSTTGTVYSNLVQIPTVDLEIAKFANPPLAMPGQLVNFTLTYSNNGSAPSTSTLLVDTLPQEMTVITTSITGGGTSTSPQIVSWKLGDLAAGAGPMSVSYAATVASTATTGSVLVNQARIGNAIDLLSLNLATANVVVSEPDVTITPNGEAWGDQNDLVYFAHRAFNTNSTAQALEVRSIHDTWGTTYTIYNDVDGDGTYDPGLDTALTDLSGTPGWFETPVLAANGGEIRLLVAFTIDPASADGDDHFTTIEAKLLTNPPNMASDVTDLTHVLNATAVTLAGFTATGRDGKVDIRWLTATEIGTVGFHVLRSETPTGAKTPMTSSMIPSRGMRSGAIYETVDESAIPGKLYWYWLQEWDTRGKAHIYGPASVDWDGDGLPDEWELRHGLSLNSDDSAADPDGDGLTNSEEFAMNTSPRDYDDTSSGPTNQYVTEDGLRSGVRTLSEGEDYIVVELSTPRCNFSQSAHGAIPAIPDYVHGWEQDVGAPELVCKGHLVKLPAGCSVTSLETLQIETEEQNSLPIRPVPQVTPVEGSDPPQFIHTFLPSGAGWSGGLKPVEAVSFVEERKVGEDKYALLHFSPLAYDGATNEVQLRRKIVVKVNFITALSPSKGAAKAIAAADWPGYPPNGRTFYRITITESGLYSISHSELVSAGWSAGTISSTNIALFGDGGEYPLIVDDSGDGFGPGDKVVFFADAFKDKYEDRVYLYLTADIGRPGIRMTSWNNSGGAAPPTVTNYRETRQLGPDVMYVPIAPGSDEEDRYFAGLLFNDGNVALGYDGTIPMSEVVTDIGENCLFRYRLSSDVSSDELAEDHKLNLKLWRAGAWQALGSAGFDGARAYAGEITLTQDLLTNGNNRFGVDLDLQAGLPQGYDRAFIDWLEVTYTRNLALQSGQLDFSLNEGQQIAQLTNVTSSALTVVHINEETGAPRVLQNTNLSGGGPYTLEIPLDVPLNNGRFVVAQKDSLLAASEVFAVNESSIHSNNSQADLVVIVATELSSTVAPLIAARQAQGLTVREFTPHEVYDHFTNGRKSPWAFRQLLAYARDNWIAPAPRFLLLVGDASWDPKDIEGNLSTAVEKLMIPTPMVMTFAWGDTPCDSLLGRLDGDDSIPSVAVGRLPVTTTTELSDIVSKLLAYDAIVAGATFEGAGVFVADEGGGEAQFFEDALDTGLNLLPAGFSVTRIHAEDYPSATGARTAIIDAINGGALVVNYQGHGSREYWSSSQIFREVDISSLSNGSQLPLLIGMTCLDGFFAHPALDNGLGEALLKSPTGGVAAAFCSAGTASLSAKRALNGALFSAFFNQGERILGDAYLESAKTYFANSSDVEDVLRSHVILGDPSMTVRLPFPANPENLQLSASGLQVTLTWSNNSETDLAGYRLLRATQPGGPYMEIAGPSTLTNGQTSFVDFVPTAGVYYYTLQAEDISGFASPTINEKTVQVAAQSISAPAGGGGGGGGCMVGSKPIPALPYLWPFLLVPLVPLIRRKLYERTTKG